MKYNRGKLWFIKQEFWLIELSLQIIFIWLNICRIKNLWYYWYVNKKSISPLFWSQPNCILWIWVPGNFRIHVTLSSSRWVSTGETARVSCHQIRHSDSQLLSHHRDFLESNSSNLTSAACAFMSQSLSMYFRHCHRHKPVIFCSLREN